MSKALGKGLEALIQNNNSEESTNYLLGKIDIEKVRPNSNQPRNYFNQQKMDELIDSIKQKGILQPITVRELNNGEYTIIAGERRYRAAKEIGLKWVPAYTIQITDESEMMEYALIENIQRENLNAMEEAEGYAILSGKHNMTHQIIADKVSKSRTEVSNKLRLLKLPPMVKESLRKQELDYGHARALLRLNDSKKIIQVYYEIINESLSVRNTEALIRQYAKQKKTKFIKNTNSSQLYEWENQLTTSLNTSATITAKKNKGNITIKFNSLAELEKLVEKIIK